MLKRLAKIWLRWWAIKLLAKYQPRIVAITGSTGKTSVKDAIYAVLAAGLNDKGVTVARTYGNLNTEFGVPATIIDADFRGTTDGPKTRFTPNDLWQLTKAAYAKWRRKADYPQILVLELATELPNDMAYFMEFIHPDVGVLTNIGDVHLEFFGGKSELANEKGRLIAGIKPNGLAILNRDDELTNLIAKKTTAKKVLVGLAAGADAVASNIALSSSGLHFNIAYHDKDIQIHMPVYGEQFVYSALVAIVVGDYFGLSLPVMAQALSNYSTGPRRFEKIELGRITLIDDTYNANPASMVAALSSLSRLAGSRRRVAILGDMKELGSAYQKGHREVGEWAAKTVDLLLTNGEGGELIRSAAVASGLPSDQAIALNDRADVFSHIRDNDMVLVKGSQAVRFDEIARLIKEKYS